ncbi:MAG: hypothetical protein HYV42_01090, partial [Candidatus Magasanikbacteria bacterium]|nr:hypothetical protein [Candidatus Magasanikbacteria bacterium]
MNSQEGNRLKQRIQRSLVLVVSSVLAAGSFVTLPAHAANDGTLLDTLDTALYRGFSAVGGFFDRVGQKVENLFVPQPAAPLPRLSSPPSRPVAPSAPVTPPSEVVSEPTPPPATPVLSPPASPATLPAVKGKKITAKRSSPRQVAVFDTAPTRPLAAALVQSSGATAKSPTFDTVKSTGNVFVGSDLVLDATEAKAILKGLRVTGVVDFTGATVTGLPTVPPPVVVYNQTTRQQETWNSVSAQVGGVTNDFSVGRNLKVDNQVTAVGGVTVGDTTTNNGNLTVNGTATLSGPVTLSNATTIGGSLTVNGSATLGDSTGDSVTLNGRVGTINISDGTNSTTTITRNSLAVAANTSGSNALGVFYVDSTGLTSASGSVRTFGNVTSSGHIYPAANNTVDLGAYGTAFRSLYASTTLQVGAAAASTTVAGNNFSLGNNTSSTALTGSSFVLGAGTNYNRGVFFVDNSAGNFGNVSTSGTLNVYGNTTLGDSDAAGGDTTRVFGTLAMGAAPTGNAQVFLTATTSGAVPLLINRQDNTRLLQISSSSVIVASAPPTADVTNEKNATLLLGDNSGIGGSGYVVLQRGGGSGNAPGIILHRNSSGAIGSELTSGGLLIGNGSTTSTVLADGSINFASGSLRTFQNVTTTGHIYPDANNTADLGAWGNAFRSAYVSTTLQVGSATASTTVAGNNLSTGDGTSSSIRTGSSLILGAGTNYNTGVFWVDNGAGAFGNTYTSGTLGVTSLATLTGGFVSAASSTVNGQLHVSGQISASSGLAIAGSIIPYTNNNRDLGAYDNAFRTAYVSTTIRVGLRTASTTISGNNLTIGQLDSGNNPSSTAITGASLKLGAGNNYDTGVFWVDNSTGNFGNTYTSGTLSVNSLSTLTGGFVSAASSTVNGQLHVSGQISASSGLAIAGSIIPYGNAARDLGAWGNAFRTLYASTTLQVGSPTASTTVAGNNLSTGDGTSSSIRTGSSLILGAGTNYNTGVFWVDNGTGAYGNTYTSGTLSV